MSLTLPMATPPAFTSLPFTSCPALANSAVTRYPPSPVNSRIATVTIARRTSTSTSARFLRSGLSSVRSPAPTALIGFTYPVSGGIHTPLRDERQQGLELHLGLGQLVGRHGV